MRLHNARGTAEAVTVFSSRGRPGGKDLALWLGSVLLAPAALAALLGPTIAPGDPFAGVAAPFQDPSLAFPFGTDDLGRDLLLAVIHGARTSLITGGAVAVLALGAGLAVGCAAGFSRSWIDDALMRMTEFFQVIPRFFLAILVLALFGQSLANLVGSVKNLGRFACRSWFDQPG